MRDAAMRRARKLSAAALAVAFLCLALTSAARAADSVYWVNYGANKISHASLGGGGGADLPIPAATFDGPWGLAIDSAAGKIYWANENNDTIGFANLDGSGSGLLNTAGATVDNPIGLAIDPPGGRIYWTSYQGNKISYANLNGSGGADVDTGSAPVTGPEGIVIDGASNRVFWSNIDGNTIGYAGLGGGGGGQLDTGGAIVNQPLGLAIDPFANRIYWASLGSGTIAYASLGGGGGGQVDTTGATLSGVAFPVLLETARNTAAPLAYGGHRPGVVLACRPGAWGGDLLESFFYQAPQAFSYQWLRNNQPIGGATSSGFTPEKAGRYTCQETATNFAGAISQMSNEVAVEPTMRLNKGSLDFKHGTATQPVTVAGRGKITLSGVGVAKRQRTNKKVTGRVTLLVKAKGKMRKRLNATGRARVKVTVSFAAEESKELRQSKTIVLKKKPRG